MKEGATVEFMTNILEVIDRLVAGLQGLAGSEGKGGRRGSGGRR